MCVPGLSLDPPVLVSATRMCVRRLAEEDEEDSDGEVPMAVRIHGYAGLISPSRLIPLTLEVCRSTAAQNAAQTPVGSLGKLQPRGSQQVHASYEKSGFLRELEDANASLLMDLEKKDAEIRRLRAISGGALSARGEQATGEIVPAGMKDQRLVELAKKNRALTVQLEAERNKTSRQTREIKELSKELQVRRTHTDAGQDNGRHECPRRAPSIHGFMLPL